MMGRPKTHERSGWQSISERGGERLECTVRGEQLQYDVRGKDQSQSNPAIRRDQVDRLGRR
jgi:hypothetical protein